MDTVLQAQHTMVGRYDHRVETAQRKRQHTRVCILDATTRVFARCSGDAPVIEDVVREAGISRGTFYKYFSTLDEALVAAGVQANLRFMLDIEPVHRALTEPWERASVCFRLHLLRSWQDPKWAGFVTRMEAWPHDGMLAKYMYTDLEQGRCLGQFRITDASVAADFIMGASARCIQALRHGVADPAAYMDAALGLTLQLLGCSPELHARALAFSRQYIDNLGQRERRFAAPDAKS